MNFWQTFLLYLSQTNLIVVCEQEHNQLKHDCFEDIVVIQP